jgi:hypothetical protein
MICTVEDAACFREAATSTTVARQDSNCRLSLIDFYCKECFRKRCRIAQGWEEWEEHHA